MAFRKELLKQQLEAFSQGVAPGTVKEEYGYYQTLYLDEIVNSLEERPWQVERVIAKEAIEYPELHDLMRKLVKQITAYNATPYQKPLWATDEDHAGAGPARELAIANKEDIETYADYYVTNDVNHEVYQIEDIEAILEKWGIGEATYPLLVARWFKPGQHAYEQLEEHFGDMEEVLEDPAQRDFFVKACANWFLKRLEKEERAISFDDKSELNHLFSELFDEVEYFEDYEDEHYEDEDFNEDDIFGSVVENFFALVSAGKTPAFADLI